jgi:hypothetical protein
MSASVSGRKIVLFLILPAQKPSIDINQLARDGIRQLTETVMCQCAGWGISAAGAVTLVPLSSGNSRHNSHACKRGE